VILALSASRDQTLIVFCFTGLPLTEVQLHEAAIQSGVLDDADDFLDQVFTHTQRN